MIAMAPKHDEVEVKFEADEVDVQDFLKWCVASDAHHEYRSWDPRNGSDAYWSGGGANPVRLRVDDRDGISELTVKARKSAASLTQRHEVNLPLRADIPAASAEAFLLLAGFAKLFEIRKKSDIVRISRGGRKFCLALYTAELVGRPETARRFLEAELEDGTDPVGLQQLAELTAELAVRFGLREPVNYSLFEYFTRVAAGELPGRCVA